MPERAKGLEPEGGRKMLAGSGDSRAVSKRVCDAFGNWLAY